MSNAIREANADGNDGHLDHQKGTTERHQTELCIRDLKVLARILTVQLNTKGPRTATKPKFEPLVCTNQDA